MWITDRILEQKGHQWKTRWNNNKVCSLFQLKVSYQFKSLDSGNYTVIVQEANTGGSWLKGTHDFVLPVQHFSKFKII